MNFESIERTFVMIKPDGVKRGLIGTIFNKFEGVGLKLVACRMIKATREQAEGNYPHDDKAWIENLGNKTLTNYGGDKDRIEKDMGTSDIMELGEQVYNGLVDLLMSGPLVIMVWEGNHAIQLVRKLAGSTLPELSAPGSIRGDYAFDTPMLAIKSGRIAFNTLIHISDSPESAAREISHWFGDNYKYLGNYDRIDYVGAFEAFN